MKKFILLVMVIAAAFCMFSCDTVPVDEDVVLTVLVEESASVDGLNKAFQYAYGDNLRLEFITLTSDPDERRTQLVRLRTEIMAGKGPDIYMLPTWDTTLYSDGIVLEPLFQDVIESMNSGLFLPLDSYIAASAHLNMEEHIQVVMEKGRNQNGQVVLPLLFDFKLVLIDTSSSDRLYSEDATLGDLLADNNEIALSVQKQSPNWINYRLCDLIDYNTSNLLVNEATLNRVFSSVVDMLPISTEIKSQEPLMLEDVDTSSLSDTLFHYINSTSNVQAIPVTNIDNGITATITAFTAIDANCKHPEDAFKFIEFLYRDEVQGGTGIWVESEERRYGDTWTPHSDMCGSYGGIPTGYVAYENDIFYNKEQMNAYFDKINAFDLIQR